MVSESTKCYELFANSKHYDAHAKIPGFKPKFPKKKERPYIKSQFDPSAKQYQKTSLKNKQTWQRRTHRLSKFKKKKRAPKQKTKIILRRRRKRREEKKLHKVPQQKED